MPNADISRRLNQPRKHYGGARLQQGRPLLDSDFNEGAEAREDQRREAFVDIIGAAGTRDDGFMPALKVGDTVEAKLVRFGASTQAYVLDYPLKSGTMYAGGVLWEQPESEPVVFQREFLQMGAGSAPRAGLGEQRQLSYLRGWEQPVTAVEDGELLEPSLGGADGAARVRRIRRVEVRNVQAADCAAAFAEVLADLGHGDTATYDPRTSELRSNARLRMTFQGGTAGECGPCEPSLEGRYLGGEGHAVRIMLTGPDRYVWAFDNAAPVYRVRLTLDGGGGARVEMLTPPKDAFHFPRQQTVVEFLPWEALLDNGRPQGGKVFGESVKNERVAARAGLLAEVDAPYDPSARSFHVRLAPGTAQQIGVGKGFTESKAQQQAVDNLKSGNAPTQDGFALRWDSQHPLDDQLNPTESSPEGFVTYLYMRAWHVRRAGDDLTVPTSALRPLGATGLVPVFTGRGRAGDFWTVTVRPEAPDEILPREIMLAGGVPPHGPREVVTRLSLVTWRSLTGFTHLVADIEDCRPTLTSLTERGCCTYDVGPGGDFETIQAAVDALPVSGGRLCLRPGVYREEVRLAGKSNVVIKGCGARTRVETPDKAEAEALFDLQLGDEGHDVTLRDFAVVSRGQIGVRAAGGSRVELLRLELTQETGETPGTPSAVQLLGVADARVRDCRVQAGGTFTHHAAVYLDAPDGVLFEHNTVETRTAADNDQSFAWGGVQVAGGSRGVELRDNLIRGGRGHGFTIGGVDFRAFDGTRLGVEGAGRGQSNPAPPFAYTGVYGPVSANPDGAGARDFFPEPQPAVDDLVVSGNRIEGMGASGVSSPTLLVEHDEKVMGPPLCFRRTTFAVTNAVVEDNQLVGNGRLRPAAPGEQTAVGGIVLSDATGVTVRGNLVEGNGAETEAPACGICVAGGAFVTLTGNRVRDNGPAKPLPVGDRGRLGPVYHAGIVVAPPDAAGEGEDDPARAPRNVHLRRNVVDQACAPAAVVVARGACHLTGNHFHSHSLEAPMAGPTVLVFAQGMPWEALDLPEGEPSPDRWLQPTGSREYLNGRAQELPAGDGAAVCFSGNEVTTNGVTSPGDGGFGAWLVSLDHLSVVGNQFAARGREPSPLPHVLAIGLTNGVALNRVAETLDRTEVSLAALGAMLTAGALNQLTHCPVIFGCANNKHPLHFAEEDNLVWFQPTEGGCDRAGREVTQLLAKFCAAFFGATQGLTRDGRIALNRFVINTNDKR